MKDVMRAVCGLLLASMAHFYSAPAGRRPAIWRPGGTGVLPGGRVMAPYGRQYITGPGPFGLAVSAAGRTVVTANGGPNRYSLTVLEENRGEWAVRHLVAPRAKDDDARENDWRSVFMGLALTGERAVYASEGNSGRVRLADLATGAARRIYDLNQGGYADSYTGDLALDEARGYLYVLDQANFRLVAIDTRRHRIAASLRLGRLPFAMALAPDKRRAYVTNLGMFEYRALPGADPKKARETGLAFPAFGFPSPEARDGVPGVPGLGDPNARESNSVAVVKLDNPEAPQLAAFVRTGLPFGNGVEGGSAPGGVVATTDRIFVSNGHNDSITVIRAADLKVEGEIPIRIPGLETLRGVLPIGLAYDERAGRLLVAEAGINALGVIDAKAMRVAGHVPVGWFPTRVALDHAVAYVSNARGFGSGPNAFTDNALGDSFLGTLRRGSVSMFAVPEGAELARQTELAMEACGFRARPGAPAPIPPGLRYVVLIVKENRTFDEVFGDIERAANGAVAGLPELARFGRRGYVSGSGGRLSLKDLDVTPNHHALAARFSFSDNFYADSDVSVDGHHWVVGAYPDAWTESSRMAAYGGQKDFRLPTSAPGRLLFAGSNSSVHPEEQPEAGSLWHHLERHGVTFRNYGEGFELAGADEGGGLKPTGARFLTNVPMPAPLYRNTSRGYPMFNMNIPDQYRAAQFIAEVESRYARGGEEFPRFVFIHLPNDHMAKPRPEDGYPYEASYVADNDYALGRMVEYLSHSRWWKQMAVFITEDDAQGGRDHVDAHRTVLLAAGPYARGNYVSHTHSGFPGLLKTILRVLRLPPLNLFDAAASDLADCFTAEPDFTPYTVKPVDPRLFVPETARDPLDPKPSPAMDDPAFVRGQHRQ
jgi:DNA-binding beta-propeller fold protein YncE